MDLSKVASLKASGRWRWQGMLIMNVEIVLDYAVLPSKFFLPSVLYVRIPLPSPVRWIFRCHVLETISTVCLPGDMFVVH